MRNFGTLALTTALATLATAAQAQTVISRQIANEPVETVITQGPNGTVVTRRPLGAVGETTIARPYGTVTTMPLYAPAYGPAVTTTETFVAAEDEPIDATVTRATLTRIPAQRRTAAARTATRRARAPVVARDDTVARSTTRRGVRTVALTPAERRIVYRTVMQQQVQRPAVATQQVVTTVPAPAPYWGGYDWSAPRYWNAPVVAADDEATLVEPVAAPARVVYTVGSVLPAGVPLYGVPQTVAVRVPATRTLSYAAVGERVYLVDPATSVVLADITQ
jgi:hypothetical protein